ncbi:MAG: tetratricopeptide repeat protein [Candidatus Viridilinea halotolerans]|uniref:Tetratricopeptide repeat protein n=1 Tax=Candidatus Viridilinea halotolerans TaxID=2491704 RepID=A0A426TWL7_9CHLR|nr:MAG: tetratricopeptide repeat protein [Candidatus Viridilinea halotolerans]
MFQQDPLLTHLLDTAFRAWQRGDLRDARRLLQRALALAEAEQNHDACLQANQLLGHVAHVRGEYRVARRHHRAALRGSRAMGFGVGIASSLHNLGLVAAGEGRHQRACALVAAAVTAYTRLRQPEAAAEARANLERLAVRR